MFTSEEYQKLKAAALILYDKGLLRALSEKSLVCLLALLSNNEPVDSLPGVTRRLGWSEKRTGRYLSELTNAKVVVAIPSQRKESGQIVPRGYHLALAATTQTEKPKSVPKSGTQDWTPTLDSKVGYQSQYPKRDAGKQSDVKPNSGVDPKYPSKKTPVFTPKKQTQKQKTDCCVVNKKNTTTQVLASRSIGRGLKRGENTESERDRASIDSQQLKDKLAHVGLSNEAIHSILSDYPHERVARQLSWLPYRNAQNPAGLLVGAIRDDWSPPQTALDAQAQSVGPSQNANETQERLARIKADQAEQKRRHERLVAIEKKLSKPDTDALRRSAKKQVRHRLGHSWPLAKPIPQTFLNAEYYRLIEAQFVKKKTP